jgi:hypothetical protein
MRRACCGPIDTEELRGSTRTGGPVQRHRSGCTGVLLRMAGDRSESALCRHMCPTQLTSMALAPRRAGRRTSRRSRALRGGSREPAGVPRRDASRICPRMRLAQGLLCSSTARFAGLHEGEGERANNHRSHEGRERHMKTAKISKANHPNTAILCLLAFAAPACLADAGGQDEPGAPAATAADPRSSPPAPRPRPGSRARRASRCRCARRYRPAWTSVQSYPSSPRTPRPRRRSSRRSAGQ